MKARPTRRRFLTILGLGVTGTVLAGGGQPGKSGSSATPITTAGPSGGPGGSGGAAAGPLSGVFYDQHIRRVTAITEVFGTGQRTTAAVVEYAAPVRNAGLSSTSFSVAGRTILRVYANDRAQKAASGGDGRYVIIELSPTDASAPTYDPSGPVLSQASVTVSQLVGVRALDGTGFPPTAKAVTNTRQTNLIVDDFQQFRYKDPQTGLSLAYNLYIPEHYDPAQKYPLVLFMPDLGVTNIDPYLTLVQGLGAVIWASPAEQAKHPAFVLAPVYPVALANDDYQLSEYPDMTVRLLRSLQEQYTLDDGRLYTTGQSGGCLTSIALDIKYPDLFAASLLVAGQWDPTQVAPMANDKLWIIVSQDDAKAFPGMNAITAALKKNGARVTSAVWNGNASAAEFGADVEALLRAGPDSNVHYVSFRKGTVIPAGESTAGAAGHRNTWRVAYTIEGVRDWLFRQHK